MNCSVDERKLYLFCDGLLDEAETGEMERHCALCPRCRAVCDEARRSLALLKQPLPQGVFLSGEKEMSVISKALDREKIIGAPRVFWSLKRELLLAAAAVVVLSLVSAAVLLAGRGRGPSRSVTAATVFAPTVYLKDTVIRIGKEFTCRAAANTAIVMRRFGSRVIHFDLSRGIVMIAARKGSYDTISVDCPWMTVLATGTHFSVSRNDSSLSVSVLEGSVRLSRPRTSLETTVVSHEICSAAAGDPVFQKTQMTPGERRKLTGDFSAMDPRDSIMLSCRGHDDIDEFPHKAGGTAKSGHYGTIRKMIRTGDYENAITAIIRYLAAKPADPDLVYCDLALCYCKTDQWENALDAYEKAAAATDDGLVREAILHRTNHILVSKLFRYQEAELGIRSYLARYPHGAWKGRETALLARVEQIRKRRQ